jgi:hypothetical protein
MASPARRVSPETLGDMAGLRHHRRVWLVKRDHRIEVARVEGFRNLGLSLRVRPPVDGGSSYAETRRASLPR